MGAFPRILSAVALALSPMPVTAPAPHATIESALSAVSCPSIGTDRAGASAVAERWNGRRLADVRYAGSWDGSQLTLAFTAPRSGPFPWSSATCRPSFCMLVGAAGRRANADLVTLEKPAGS
jgi:hypothetical protein